MSSTSDAGILARWSRERIRSADKSSARTSRYIPFSAWARPIGVRTASTTTAFRMMDLAPRQAAVVAEFLPVPRRSSAPAFLGQWGSKEGGCAPPGCLPLFVTAAVLLRHAMKVCNGGSGNADHTSWRTGARRADFAGRVVCGRRCSGGAGAIGLREANYPERRSMKGRTIISPPGGRYGVRAAGAGRKRLPQAALLSLP